jgi:hypothetical protein
MATNVGRIGDLMLILEAWTSMLTAANENTEWAQLVGSFPSIEVNESSHKDIRR